MTITIFKRYLVSQDISMKIFITANAMLYGSDGKKIQAFQDIWERLAAGQLVRFHPVP